MSNYRFFDTEEDGNGEGREEFCNPLNSAEGQKNWLRGTVEKYAERVRKDGCSRKEAKLYILQCFENGWEKASEAEELRPEIEKSFRWAAEHSDAELFYNDYGLPYDEEKRERVYQLLSNLLDKGVPIDGIGIQMHFIGIRATSDEVAETIQRFQELGLEVRMTEMDIAYQKDEAPANIGEEQAKYYGEVFQTCLENGITSLSVWGVRDNESWINHFRDYDQKYTDRPLLFDKNGNKKKAYSEVKKELQSGL